MFYTHKEFYAAVQDSDLRVLSIIRSNCLSSDGTLSKKKVADTLTNIKKGILSRRSDMVVGLTTHREPYRLHLGKIMRPWEVVPALRDFQPPEGDFGVGVEVEYGFRSDEAAKAVMYHVRNWKHVALDREGGLHGVETTFAPILYSKLSYRDKPFRYLKYLAANSGLLAPHMGMVGTHINVSAHRMVNTERVNQVNSVLMHLSSNQNSRYFGRTPYGYIYARGNPYGKFVEMKMFNSTAHAPALRRYINVAVSLMKVITSNEYITRDRVIAALEAGVTAKV